MFILKYKKLFLGISALLVLASVVSLFVYKLQFGIEFTGGSVIDFTTNPHIEESVLKQRLDAAGDTGYSLRTAGDAYNIRTKTLTETEKNELLSVLTSGKPQEIQVQKFDTVGPTLGNELKTKALASIVIVIACITLFIAYAFRKVSTPVSSWKYGFITMIALVHDIAIVLGVFSILGHFAGVEVDSLFLTALLVILGYSINDTIVVFDRVRENLAHNSETERVQNFEGIVGESLSQTVVRSINTSVTTLLSTAIIFVLTTGAVHYFALALLIGIASGTYSSIFVAAPLLTYFNKAKKA